MTKVKTSKLTGIALDWAVAKCEGWKVSVAEFRKSQLSSSKFAYSSVWAKGGPIIERENITVRPVFHAERTESGTDIYRQDGWAAHIEPKAFWVTPRPFTGPTPLIAAMRCYVASRLGDEVIVPEELS